MNRDIIDVPNGATTRSLFTLTQITQHGLGHTNAHQFWINHPTIG